MAAPKTDLLQGTLDLIVLKLLRAGPANGWDLTQSIQLVSKGALDVNYGSLYPALRRLEAKGWIKGRWGTSENNRRARPWHVVRVVPHGTPVRARAAGTPWGARRHGRRGPGAAAGRERRGTCAPMEGGRAVLSGSDAWIAEDERVTRYRSGAQRARPRAS